MSFFNNITRLPLPASEYFVEEHPKKQIYLHHTAGNADPVAVRNDWASDKRGKIATSVIIGGWGKNDGKIVQAFVSKYWAYHLGVKQSTFQEFKIKYQPLDEISIGIELCNWGQLTISNGKYYNYVGREVPAEQVCRLETPYKGFRYFQKYTPTQLEIVAELVTHWGAYYKIPLKYNPDIWQITPRALKGEPGLYTHNSVRRDKVDVYPQPELIAMLKSL